MKITIEAESKEIADLVVAIQSQHAEKLSRYQKVNSKASD